MVLTSIFINMSLKPWRKEAITNKVIKLMIWADYLNIIYKTYTQIGNIVLTWINLNLIFKIFWAFLKGSNFFKMLLKVGPGNYFFSGRFGGCLLEIWCFALATVYHYLEKRTAFLSLDKSKALGCWIKILLIVAAEPRWNCNSEA